MKKTVIAILWKIKQGPILFIALLLVALCSSGCVDTYDTSENISGNLVELPAMPAGYELMDIASYGKFEEHRIYLLSHGEDGNIYAYDGKGITDVIAVPAGHTFFRASAYGQFERILILFFKNDSNGKIYAYQK